MDLFKFVQLRIPPTCPLPPCSHPGPHHARIPETCSLDLTIQRNPGSGWKAGGGGEGQPQIRGKYLLFKQKMKEFGQRGGGEPYHPLGSANDSVIIAHLIYPNRPVSISK